MKIQYMSTLDDAVAVQMKLAMSLKTTQRNKLIGLLGAPLFFGFVYLSESDKEIWVRIGISLFIACVYIGLYLIFYKHSYRNYIKKVLIETRGTEEDIPAEYELTDNQLIYKENGYSVAFDLNSIVSIEKNDKSIIIQFKNKGIALFVNRIFKDDNQKHEWLRHIEEGAQFSLRKKEQK